MSVHGVPRRRWVEVLEEFSRGHRGWLASVVTVGPGPELLSHTELRPLESITVAQTGGHPTTVRVRFLGGRTALIKTPRTLGVDRRDDGAERALEIDAAEAEFVRIAFRATALPEELDGIAPAELTASAARLKSWGTSLPCHRGAAWRHPWRSSGLAGIVQSAADGSAITRRS